MGTTFPSPGRWLSFPLDCSFLPGSQHSAAQQHYTTNTGVMLTAPYHGAVWLHNPGQLGLRLLDVTAHSRRRLLRDPSCRCGERSPRPLLIIYAQASPLPLFGELTCHNAGGHLLDKKKHWLQGSFVGTVTSKPIMSEPMPIWPVAAPAFPRRCVRGLSLLTKSYAGVARGSASTTAKLDRQWQRRNRYRK